MTKVRVFTVLSLSGVLAACGVATALNTQILGAVTAGSPSSSESLRVAEEAVNPASVTPEAAAAAAAATAQQQARSEALRSATSIVSSSNSGQRPGSVTLAVTDGDLTAVTVPVPVVTPGPEAASAESTPTESTPSESAPVQSSPPKEDTGAAALPTPEDVTPTPDASPSESASPSDSASASASSIPTPVPTTSAEPVVEPSETPTSAE